MTARPCFAGRVGRDAAQRVLPGDTWDAPSGRDRKYRGGTREPAVSTTDFRFAPMDPPLGDPRPVRGNPLLPFAQVCKLPLLVNRAWSPSVRSSVLSREGLIHFRCLSDPLPVGANPSVLLCLPLKRKFACSKGHLSNFVWYTTCLPMFTR